MDLLTSSGSSVTAGAAGVAGKAVETWAVLRPFGGTTTVDLLLRWAPLDTVAEFGALTITVALA
jgi:hypothetical protein